jgi:hypothetical protein
MGFWHVVLGIYGGGTAAAPSTAIDRPCVTLTQRANPVVTLSQRGNPIVTLSQREIVVTLTRRGC